MYSVVLSDYGQTLPSQTENLGVLLLYVEFNVLRIVFWSVLLLFTEVIQKPYLR